MPQERLTYFRTTKVSPTSISRWHHSPDLKNKHSPESVHSPSGAVAKVRAQQRWELDRWHLTLQMWLLAGQAPHTPQASLMLGRAVTMMGVVQASFPRSVQAANGCRTVSTLQLPLCVDSPWPCTRARICSDPVPLQAPACRGAGQDAAAGGAAQGLQGAASGVHKQREHARPIRGRAHRGQGGWNRQRVAGPHHRYARPN